MGLTPVHLFCKVSQFFLCFYFVLDLTSEIDDINGLFIEAFNWQDVEAASQLFTEDCIIMQTGSDSLYGRESQLPLFFILHCYGWGSQI